jgi:glyoxylase-like metal-dependent hydrolase (beta-lactamase superfamily II)
MRAPRWRSSTARDLRVSWQTLSDLQPPRVSRKIAGWRIDLRHDECRLPPGSPPAPSARGARMSGFQVGSVSVVPLLDGTGRECARDILTRPGTADPWSQHKDQVDAAGDIHLPLGGFLVRAGDRVVLVDAGVGAIDNGRYRGGLFLESLRMEGLEPDAVTDVVFTHLHFDHVGWATRRGEVVFTQANHHVHEADWEHFVTSPGAAPGAVRKLSPLESRLTLFGTDTTIAPGIDARPAIGHTPGTTVYVISDGGERAVLLGDVAHAVVELTEPGWSFRFDWDPERGTSARDDLVNEFVDTGTVLAGGHFRPGLLRRVGGSIEWQTI